MRNVLFVGSLLLTSALAGCGGRSAQQCRLGVAEDCRDGQVCENLAGGTQSAPRTGCFAPVEVRGRVFNAADNSGLVGARVVALDPNGAAVSDVAVTVAEGRFTLRIPSERAMDGTPTVPTHSLRADAANFQSFPGGVRPALPVDTSTLTRPSSGPLVVENSSTDVGLFPLPSGSRAEVAGTVQGTDRGGVLVVGGGATALSGRDGTYVLFNVTPGAVTVRGYAQNVQLEPAMTAAMAGARASGVDLRVASGALGTVTGSLQLVNAGGVGATSVVLAVRDTYNTVLDRGEVPRGLRLGGISGAFTFQGVPAGEYAVLAAYENDGLVRDPDPGISGTDVVYVTVPATGGSVALPQSFKVTGALAVRSPGAQTPEAINTDTPTFRWADDSSEDGYELRVYDTLGTVLWQNLMLPSASGSGDVTAVYAGPAFTPGRYYQFRVTSWRSGRGGMARAPISRSEELRGVFYRSR